jgi:hypothetical protein
MMGWCFQRRGMKSEEWESEEVEVVVWGGMDGWTRKVLSLVAKNFEGLLAWAKIRIARSPPPIKPYKTFTNLYISVPGSRNHVRARIRLAAIPLWG